MHKLFRLFLLLSITCCTFFGCNRGMWFGESYPYCDDFEYLILKGKLKFVSQSEKANLRIQARIKRDHMIWISITAILGIEVLRIRIDKEGIAIINKRNKKYIKYDYTTLASKLGFKVSFKLIQRLILAQNKFKEYKIMPKKDLPIGTLEVYKEKSNNLLIQTALDKSDHVDHVLIIDENTQNILQINYDHEIDHIVPYIASTIYIRTNSEDLGGLEFTLKIRDVRVKVSQNPINFPFDTPSNEVPNASQ